MSKLLSLPGALALCLAIAGQSVAAAWNPAVPVSGFAHASALVTLQGRVAVAVFEVCVDIGSGMCSNEVRAKRSTDGGATWGSRVRIAGSDSEADMAAATGRGDTVDVVYRSSGLFHRRSADAALTFGRRHTITTEGSVREPDVSRGPRGVLAVSYGEWPTFVDQISVKVSTDGGRSWGNKASWPTAETDTSSVAVGDGVIYVAYLDARGRSALRRSLDAGETWSAPLVLSAAGFAVAPVVAAYGSRAVVAFESVETTQYRVTDDRGAHWAARRTLGPPTWASYNPELSFQGGVIRATFQTDEGLFYSQTRDELNWIPPERIAPSRSLMPTHYVGFVGRPIVLFETYTDVMTRTRAGSC